MKHPNTDAHRIAPKLWVGSYPDALPEGHGFDVIVLCARELQTLPERVESSCLVVRAPLNDHRPTADEARIALRAALWVHRWRKHDMRVLVTCAQGLNRSALVAAMSLVFSGSSSVSAIATVREKRKHPSGYTPLNNGDFVKLLHTLRPENIRACANSLEGVTLARARA